MNPLKRIALLISLLVASHADVFSSTSVWTGAQDSNFDNAANWSNGIPTDIAAFNSTKPTSISLGYNYSSSDPDLSTSTPLNGLTFNPGAAAYTISVSGSGSGWYYLMLGGSGITNNSSNTQTIHNNGGLTSFYGTATAGNVTLINDDTTDGYEYGYSIFAGSSTAANAKITNNYGVLFVEQNATLAKASVSNTNGGVDFHGYGSAGSAQINNYGDGGMGFYDSSSADNATITTASGTGVNFYDTSTSSSAHITNNGTVQYFNNSTAGGASIVNSSGSTTFTDASNAGAATITNNMRGNTSFGATSSAGNATLINNSGGSSTFSSTTTAASATIVNYTGGRTTFTDSTMGGRASIANAGGYTFFSANSSASSATIVNTANGNTIFNDFSTAGNSTITNNGGDTGFYGHSTAGNALITNSLGESLSFSDSSTAGNATLLTTGMGIISFYTTSSAGNAKMTTDAGGEISLLDDSTAGNATIDNKNSGFAAFDDRSSAGNAHITNESGSNTEFFDNASGSNATIVNNSGSFTYFGNTSTAGSAVITNGGYTTFTDNSNAGNATITNINGSSLYFWNNASAANATIVNLSGGNERFYGDSTAGNSIIQNAVGDVYFSSNSTAGYATLINGNGSMFFQDNSTAGNATLVNNGGGTVDISGLSSAGMSAGLISGAGAYVLGSKNLTVGGSAMDSNVSGVISGVGGSLTKIGSGSLTLSGLNTYTGGTHINGGLVAISNDRNLGDASGALIFDGGSLQTLAGISSSRAITLNAGGGTVDTNALNSTFSGIINGRGSLTKNDAGTLTLQGANTYAGATFINAGTLQAGRPGTFSNASAVVLANSSGATLDLNSLDQGIGSLAGGGLSGGNVLLGSATLTTGFDNTSTTFSGGISGSGSLVKTGSGTFTLAGINTYTGNTIVNDGVLAVGGTTVSAGVSQSHASALGSGGNLILNSGTLKSVANGFGAIQVDGDYVQNGGTLDLRLGGGSSQGNYDRLIVGGAAHLGGTLELDVTGGTFTPGEGQTFGIIQSTSITGNFAVLNGPAGLNFTFAPVSGGINVAVSQNDFAPLAITSNQQAVGGYIDQFSRTAQGDLSAVVGALNTLSASQIPAALNELSPQRYEMYSDVAVRSAAFTTQGLDAHLGRLRSGAVGLDMGGMVSHHTGTNALLADAAVGRSQEAWDYPTDDLDDAPTVASASTGSSAQDIAALAINPNLGAFVSGNVLFANQHGTQDLQKSNFTTEGTMGGLDYRWNDHLATGVLLSYTHTNVDLDNEGSTAKVRGYAPGVYAAYFDDYVYLNGLVSYGLNSYDASRNMVFGDLNRTAQSTTKGHQFLGDLKGGTDYHLGSWIVGPTAGLSYVKLKVNGFTENGSDATDLLVSDQNSDSLRSRLGGQINRPFKLGTTLWTSGLHAAWQHEYLNNSQSITAAFDQPSLGTFSIQTTAPQRDSALVGVGMSAHLTKALTLSVNYDAQAGQSSFFAQSIRGGGSFRF